MKTGLTKKQKTTSIFFTDADDMIEVCTHNTPLKNRLAAFAEEYPSECRLTMTKTAVRPMKSVKDALASS